MNPASPFIKREHELVYIDRLINEWGSRRMLFIQAPAGLGKTRLLNEIRALAQQQQEGRAPLAIADIIDFDDPSLHLAQNIGRAIASMFDPKIFEPYLRVLLDWRKMGMTSISSERLSHASFAINQTFINCFSMLSAQRRVVLFFDTIDALANHDGLDYLEQILPHLENTVVFLAGRTRIFTPISLRTKAPHDVEVMSLPPLSEQASETYIRRKRDSVRLPPDPLLTRAIIPYTKGHPLLLESAVAAATENALPKWLTAPENGAQAPDDPQRAFEHALAHHIAAPQTQIGRLILTLSHIYPLDVPMMVHLFDCTEHDATDLLRQATAHYAMRPLPGNRLELHETIRDLINDHVWPARDPSGDERRRQCRHAIVHLAREAESLAEHIYQMSITPSAPDAPSSITLNQFMEREILERALAQLRLRHLRYALFADPDDGLITFTRMFDEATDAYRFRFRQTLFHHLEPYHAQFSPAQQYEWKRRSLLCMLDSGNENTAYTKATQMLTEPHYSPTQRVRLLLARAQAAISLGQFDASLSDCAEALRLSHEHSDAYGHLDALAIRGTTFRSQGNHECALDDYLEAYQLSIQLNHLRQTAWLLADISIVHALKGNREAAFESARAALDIAQTGRFLRCIGVVYGALGVIYVRFDQPAEAMKYYTRALDIFSTENDIVWMSFIHCERSYAFQTRGELDRADEALDLARQHAAANLQPRIAYFQALICWARHDLAAARRHLQTCHTLSREMGDQFHEYKSFADLIELAWEFGEYSRWRELSEQLHDLHRESEAEDTLRLRGSCLRKLADMAICYGEYDAALAAYREGLSLIAAYEIHERYTLRSQMKQTDQRIRERIPAQTLARLSDDLFRFWKEQRFLLSNYPDALLTFHRWGQEPHL